MLIYNHKGKNQSKAVPLSPCRQQGGEEFLIILDLCSRWGEWSASCPGRALPPGKGPPLPTG